MRKKSLLFIFLALSVALNAQVKNVIIDADTDNELDDLPSTSTVLQNIVVYEDPRFYATFPSIAKSDDGFIVAFRRAPNRTGFGKGTTPI